MTDCLAVFASPPCSTWSAARFEPGTPQVLRTAAHPMGVPQSDGRLPAAVVRANAVVDTCVQAARAVMAHGGDF
eukprot:4965862-Pleurochrysis_carterae.AAC.1